MALIRMFPKLIALIGITLLFTACGQTEEGKCDLQDPVLVQVGNELFGVPVDSEIYISLKQTSEGGPLGYFCPEGEPPYQLRRLGINGKSSLLAGVEFAESYRVLQFWIYPRPNPPNSVGSLYSTFKRLHPEIVIEDLPVERGFHVFQYQKVTYFVARSNNTNKAPLTFECNTNKRIDFRGEPIGHFCSSTYRYLPGVGLSYRFYSPKIPDERWFELDSVIHSALESIRVSTPDEVDGQPFDAAGGVK